MKQGMSVDLFTTENSSRSFIKQMESMSLDISEYFAWGYLKIFPLHADGSESKKEEMAGILPRLINYIGKSKSPVIIIDSLTLFTEYTDTDHILTFFTNCKTLVDRGKTIVVTLHSYAFEEETLVRIRSICDAHFTMRKALIGSKYVMVMEVIKVRGAKRTTGNLVSFEVHPGYGMKVIPMSFARV
jgi:flagellar protein FlaH